MRRLMFLWGLSLWLLTACESKESPSARLKNYSGPRVSTEGIETVYSDSARVKIRVAGPLSHEYTDGDREYPQGIEVDFYNEKGEHTTRLKARYGRYDRSQEVYVVTGQVFVENFAEKRRLYTEELRWIRLSQQVETDKFVRIVTPREILTGVGLTAKQDFSYYRILRPGTTLPNDQVF